MMMFVLLPYLTSIIITAFVANNSGRGVDDRNNNNNSNDWLEADFTLRKFPTEPSPYLSAEAVATGCLRCLQFVDHPSENSGLKRLHPFLTWACIKHVVGRNNEEGNLGGVERFCELGSLSPVLQPLFGATKVELYSKDATVMPGTATRGTIVSMNVKVTTAEVMKFQHKSGAIRDGVSVDPPQVDMIIRLIQERRPPLAGCWLVRDIIDAKYASGGMGWGRHEGV